MEYLPGSSQSQPAVSYCDVRRHEIPCPFRVYRRYCLPTTRSVCCCGPINLGRRRSYIQFLASFNHSGRNALVHSFGMSIASFLFDRDIPASAPAQPRCDMPVLSVGCYRDTLELHIGPILAVADNICMDGS